MKQLKLIEVQRNLSINNVDVLNQITAIHRGIYFLRRVVRCYTEKSHKHTSSLCYKVCFASVKSTRLLLQSNLDYRIAGNFRGVKYSLFLWAS